MTDWMLGRRALLAGAGALVAAPAVARTTGGDRWPALRALVSRYIAEKKVPGAAVAIVRPGRFRPDWIIEGEDAFTGGRPVTKDTLWRIYSMTKPLTGMMAMAMVAEGKLRLDQPIGDVLPEFAAMRVQTDPANSLASRPAERPILLRHLLTHTAGLGYSINGNGPLEKEYKRLGLQPGSSNRFLAPGDGAIPDLQTFVKRLATLPLRSEPGTGWHYSVANDLLGGLMERVGGAPLDVLMQRMLLKPLGMDSTRFQVRAADARRLSTNYAWIGLDGKPLATPQPIDTPVDSDWLRPPAMFSGGGGLAASASDYARFAQMLVNGGGFERGVVLRETTVRQGMSNLMPPGVFYEKMDGFGASGRLTLFDTLKVAPDGSPAGSYGWGGAAGTLFQVDPVRGVGVVVMLQYLPQQRFPLPKELQVALNQDLA
ncbi:serine hydrolase [Polymorphobacter multimanifer]|uniref:CubicO group peptidase (Beta-lactamase class C family) n=1 Tax=Polymorphobacter multimanifer TaxID=1070431 RepID=A0A841LDC5_9SPHN|nr:serine hydrolase domain-containing protein [Polymorphobacter multimanifer]MBB6229003.1 CubicO group peptidase (beta-lactamase class C family) [Polymorphobacter multimanifer]GGI78526.1 serine hydrolase [Polymorphobacter multimanifer]